MLPSLEIVRLFNYYLIMAQILTKKKTVVVNPHSTGLHLMMMIQKVPEYVAFCLYVN